jgi:uncharacterized delta-60 repeat protein
MNRGRRRLGIAVAGLAASALLAGTAAAGAGPGVEKLHLSRSLGAVEQIVADGPSHLLLLGGYEEDTIRRIDDDGSLDRSFGDGGTVQIGSRGVTVTGDGKILVAGAGPSLTDPGDSDATVTRLLPNGKPDPSFGVGGTATVDFGGRYDGGQATAVAPNGEIILGGYRQTLAGSRGGSDATPAVARLNADGTLRRSFGDEGVRILAGGEEGGVFDVAAGPGGGTVVMGEAPLGTAIWELTADGSIDPGFGRRGRVEIVGRDKRGAGATPIGKTSNWSAG